MRRLIAAVLVFSLVNAAFLIAQAPPELINLQGRLTDASGNAITANTDMRFEVYDASSGGNLLLSDEHAGGSAVTVTDGHYNTLLGGGTLTTGTESDLAAVFANNSGVYVEIYVHNGSIYEMLSPRVQLLSSAYALNSALSQDSALLEGQPGSHYKQDLTDVLGQGADAGGAAITNLLDPTNPQDAATRNYVDSQASSLSTQVTTNTTNISTNSGNITANSSAISTLQSTVTTNTTNITSNTTGLSSLQSTYTAHEANGAAHHALTLAASATDISTTEAEIDQALDGVSGNVTAANLNILTGGGETALHAHASGSGSSLDADLLDSIDSASFLRSDTTDAFTGTQLTVTGSLLAIGSNFIGDDVADLHTITGNVAIGTTAANSQMEVDGDVSLLTNALKFGNSGSEDVSIYRSAANVLRTDDVFQVAGDSQHYIQIDSYTNSSAGSVIQVRKARGVEATPAGVQIGDVMGYLNFMGHDGTTFRNGAQIMSMVDATPGASDFPTNLMFRTVPDGSIIPAEAMRITSDQNVGIGSNNPTQRLDVVGTVKASAFVGDGSGLTGVAAGTATDTDTLDSLDSTDFLRSTADSTLTATNTLTVAGTLDITNAFHIAGTAVTSSAAELNVLDGVTGSVTAANLSTLTGGTSADSLHNHTLSAAGGWTDGGSDVALSTSTDNVGIGTTTTTSRLHVRGATVDIALDHTSVGQKFTMSVNGAGQFIVNNVNNSAIGLVVSPTGTVAVGSTTPSAKLHVIDNTAGLDALLVDKFSTGDLAIFKSAGAEKVVINNNGNLGIGTTNPTALLHIHDANPRIRIADTTNGQVYLQSINSLDWWCLTDQNAGVNRFVVLPNGNVGLTSGTPSARFFVDDDAAGDSLKVNDTNGAGALAVFMQNSNIKALIDIDGNLGLGGVSPSATLTLGAVASDPGSPTDGSVWYNSTDGHFKFKEADGVRDIPDPAVFVNVQRGYFVPDGNVSIGLESTGIYKGMSNNSEPPNRGSDSTGIFYQVPTNVGVGLDAYVVTGQTVHRPEWNSRIMIRFSLPDITAVRCFLGMTSSADNTMLGSDNPAAQFAGLQFSTVRGDTNLQFVSRSATTMSVTDTGVAAAAATSYILYVEYGNNSAEIYYELLDDSGSVLATHTETTNLPSFANNQYVLAGVESQTGAGTRAINIYYGWGENQP